jgi:hypothetical protein
MDRAAPQDPGYLPRRGVVAVGSPATAGRCWSLPLPPPAPAPGASMVRLSQLCVTEVDDDGIHNDAGRPLHPPR